MDIHEYQAKEILASFGVTIPRGGIVYSPETAENKAREIGGSKWVVKAQIHSGARGKAGGVIVCNSPLEVAQATDKLLGKKLVTNQTGPEGKIVNRIYIEEASRMEKAENIQENESSNTYQDSKIKKALNEIEGINKQIDLLNKTINNQIK